MAVARRSPVRSPSIRASAGRTNRWKVTIAETGLPGRPKTSAGSRRPEPGRVPGSQGDTPEDLLHAELRERRLDVVVGPDRDPAGGHHHVGRQRPPQRVDRVAVVVADGLDGERGPSGARNLGRDGVAVRVAYLSGGQWRPRLHQLVPGDDDRNAGPAGAGQLGRARGGGDSELRRADARYRPRNTTSPAAMSSAARRISVPGDHGAGRAHGSRRPRRRPRCAAPRRSPRAPSRRWRSATAWPASSRPP